MKKFLIFLLLISMFGLTACDKQKGEVNTEVEVLKNTRKKGYHLLNIGDYEVVIESSDSNIINKDKLVYNSPLSDFVNNELTYDESISIDKLDFNEVKNIVNEEKKSIANKNKEFYNHPYTYYYGTDDERKGKYDKLSQSEYDELLKEKYGSRINKEQALEDVITLDRIFRSCYGPLKIMGIENFDKAHNNLLNKINKLNDGELLSFNVFNRMVIDEYNFIRDLHFQFTNGERSAAAHDLATDGYYFDDYYFLKDDNGYYLKDYSPKTYLTSVKDDTNLDEYLHFGIEPTGELAYVISFYDLEKLEDKSCNIVLKDREFKINLKQMDGANNYRDNIWQSDGNWNDEAQSFTEINNYPIISIRAYDYITNNNYPNFDKYGSSAKACKDEKVIIHDTRSNGGGSSPYMDSFYLPIAGISPDMEKTTSLNWSSHRYIYGEDINLVFSPFDHVLNGLKNILITLTDAKSGSCGDYTVAATKILNDGIVIGEPTEGCMIGGNLITYYLPNSGLSVSATKQVMMDGLGLDGVPDGIGIPPDIWVDSDEALDLTVAMLDYYDIHNSNRVKNIVDKQGFGTNNLARRSLLDIKNNHYKATKANLCNEILTAKSIKLNDNYYVTLDSLILKNGYELSRTNLITPDVVGSNEFITRNGINYVMVKDSICLDVKGVKVYIQSKSLEYDLNSSVPTSSESKNKEFNKDYVNSLKIISLDDINFVESLVSESNEDLSEYVLELKYYYLLQNTDLISKDNPYLIDLVNANYKDSSDLLNLKDIKDIIKTGAK